MFQYKREKLIAGEENINISIINETKNVEDHIHDFFELVYTLNGSITHYVDGIEYKMSHGDLLFINKDQTHSYTVEDHADIINILLNPEFIGKELINSESILFLFKYGVMSEFKNVNTILEQSVSFRGKHLEEADTVILMLLREYSEKRTGYLSIISGAIKILFSNILRCLDEEYLKRFDNRSNFEEVFDYIDENLDSKISVTELAARSFYTPAYFGSLIKKHCNKTFNAYLREKRLKKAAELLRSSDASVKKIMLLVGYRDAKTFYEHFKKMYGMTPAKYGKQFKGNSAYCANDDR